MNYRRIGKSGLKVSEISFGTFINFNDTRNYERNEACVVAAYESGINFFDGAEAYGDEMGVAEKTLGKIFQKARWPRDSFIVSGKLIPGGHGPQAPVTAKGLNRKHIVDGCNATLRRMGLEYLDLFFCHRPDSETPIEETISAIDILIKQGKILYWGTSCYSQTQLEELYLVAHRERLQPPIVEQAPYNMLQRRSMQKLQPFIAAHGMGVTAFSPLAGGVLTGKYLNSIPAESRCSYSEHGWVLKVQENKMEKAKALYNLSEEMDLPMNRLALAWALMNDSVSTLIMGASRPEQVRENVIACEDSKWLTDEVMKRIERILES